MVVDMEASSGYLPNNIIRFTSKRSVAYQRLSQMEIFDFHTTLSKKGWDTFLDSLDAKRKYNTFHIIFIFLLKIQLLSSKNPNFSGETLKDLYS